MLGLGNLGRMVFGSANDRRVKRYRPLVAEINALEPEIAALSDAELRAKTDTFRQQIADGDRPRRPSCRRLSRPCARPPSARSASGISTCSSSAGWCCNEGSIAEMKTGEGKTLVATLPVYLNALAGKGVHVVTVNDYLARRDAEWMGRIYEFLGLTVGVIVHGLTPTQRRQAYAADVTYGTNNEFGFDYLRDNMEYNLAEHGAARALLRDRRRGGLRSWSTRRARRSSFPGRPRTAPSSTPRSTRSSRTRRRAISSSTRRRAPPTSPRTARRRIEQTLAAPGLFKGESLYDVENVAIVHHLNNALRAHKLFQRDKDYIVKNGQVIIIDEFTGRMMEGRRYSDGLHQALEAKEHVKIQPENQTLASITFQNYFRLYEKLAGMTGTAATEADEFGNIYNLDVVEVPTNMPMIRADEDDEVYRTVEEKYKAIVELIDECRERGQPVLVGTTSIEKSELLAERLRKRGWQQLDFSDPQDLAALFNVNETKSKIFTILNARYHEQEAYIVAQAGVPGAVTIATNMAGRGTDIQLGGNADMRVQPRARRRAGGAGARSARERRSATRSRG